MCVYASVSAYQMAQNAPYSKGCEPRVKEAFASRI